MSDDIGQHHLMPMSGTDLKVERVKAGLTIREQAARMGISRQAVWGLERSARVSPDRSARYLAALVTSPDVNGEAVA